MNKDKPGKDTPPEASAEQRRSTWHKPLDPDDLALWNDLKKTVKRLPKNAKAATARQPGQKRPATATAPGKPPAAKSKPKMIVIKPMPVTPEKLSPMQAALRPAIDRVSFRKIKTGRVDIEDRLDLHGYFQDNGHAALTAFVERSAARGLKLVLVVTGKGERIYGDTDSGVLRRMVPLWLEEKRCAPFVLSYRTAAKNHGGEGAFYVRLRRKRPTA